MTLIRFKTNLFKIGSWTIIKLPKNASAKLPSRGMTMVKGLFSGQHFQSALEPDGNGSHWLRVDSGLQKSAGVAAGDNVTLAIESAKNWPEPEMPADLKKGLDGDPKAHSLWIGITPMARWDWIRWIRATNQQETRKRRIDMAFSKLKAGERRPCCFNRTMCTVPDVSKNGVLIRS